MIWILDDQHLSTVLRSGRMPPFVQADEELYTTGYWYVRLCQAVSAAHVRGRLSGPFAGLTAAQRASALEAVAELPDEIGLMSLRALGPVIGRLRRHHRLNILGLEALAAAVTLDGHVVLSGPSPVLQSALSEERCLHTMVRP